MRIGIDLHMVNDFMQGSRTHVYNVTQALIELDRHNDYFLYFTHKPRELPAVFNQPRVHIRTIFPSTRLVRLPVSFPLKLAIDQIDVFHCQYMGPPFLTMPYVVTIHDILHETHPEFYKGLLRYFMCRCYPFSARRAARVLTVSEYSRQEIIKHYRIPEHRLAVTYNAVSGEFRPVTDPQRIQQVKRKYGIGSNYILFVGRLEPRKNIPNLIRAYHLLKERLDSPPKLVIAGMKDFMFEHLFETTARLKLVNDVVFTGRVDQEDLPVIYSAADLFVYPAYAEGFGIPPLEAMACGVPVITSNTTSLPEVVGNAAMMVPPEDITALSQAMAQVLKNPEVQQDMRARGLRRVRLFSWTQTAARLLETYQAVHAESQSR